MQEDSSTFDEDEEDMEIEGRGFQSVYFTKHTSGHEFGHFSPLYVKRFEIHHKKQLMTFLSLDQ